MIKNIKRQGISSNHNIVKEEITYFIGSQNNIPIALLLMIASKQENAIARYFNQITFTTKSIEWQKEILKDKISITPEFIQLFEGSPIITKKTLPFQLTPVSEDWLNKRYNPSYDEPLPLHIYAKQFAKLISMATPQYESGIEGVVLTCPMSYINFWNREQFSDLTKSLNIAIDHVLDDVVRILKLRNIPFNEEDMTIPMSNYSEHKFIFNYGW